MTPSALSPTRAWSAAAASVAALFALALAPPLLGGESGEAVRFAFSHVCHQIPERSLALAGGPVALCHRCLGVVGGLALGTLAAPLVPRLGVLGRVRAGRSLALAALPMAVDWTVGALGLWANTPLSRSATGALFGAVAGLFLAHAFLDPPRPTLTPSYS